jgi:hypothetical protein
MFLQNKQADIVFGIHIFFSKAFFKYSDKVMLFFPHANLHVQFFVIEARIFFYRKFVEKNSFQCLQYLFNFQIDSIHRNKCDSTCFFMQKVATAKQPLLDGKKYF